MTEREPLYPHSGTCANPSPDWKSLAGMVKTRHGWARPCSLCGSTNFGRPCRNAEDGFHR